MKLAVITKTRDREEFPYSLKKALRLRPFIHNHLKGYTLEASNLDPPNSVNSYSAFIESGFHLQEVRSSERVLFYSELAIFRYCLTVDLTSLNLFVTLNFIIPYRLAEEENCF